MIIARRFRKVCWWLAGFLKKQKKLILLTSLLAIFIFVLGRNLLPLLPHLKSTTRVGLVGQYTLNTLPFNITRVFGRGLFRLTDDGRAEPDLAQGWQVSEEETRYRIFLKPGQTWSDQTQIIAADLSFDLPNIEISYPDQLTVEFKLSQPYSPFLTLLARPLFKNKTSGAGEYSIKSIEWQGQWLKRLRLTGPEKELDYRFYLSHQAAWLGFRLGEVDRLENLVVNPADEHWLAKIKSFSYLNRQAYIAILFNLQDSNLANKSLRQALAYALKNKSGPEDSRALSPISPDSWAYNPTVKPYDFNPNQANELFLKFKEENQIDGSLELTLGTSTSLLSLAEKLADSWEETLKIKVNVKTLNSLEPDWQALLIVQEIPYDPDQHALWHSTQKTNLTHYSDFKVDKLLEDGRQISDQSRRLEIYQDFQRFIVEDSPAIFLFHPTVYTLER